MTIAFSGTVSPARWELLERNRSALLAIARRRCASVADAEDCVQEALLRVASFAELDEERAPRMLTSVVTRLAADTHRRRARVARATSRLRADVDPLFVDAEVCDRAEAEWLAGHVEALPALQRDVLLARAAGAEWDRVAVDLHTTYKAVESAAARARRTLRARLSATALIFVALARRLRSAGAPAVAGAATAAILAASISAGGAPQRSTIAPPSAVEFGSLRVDALPDEPEPLSRVVVSPSPPSRVGGTPPDETETYERVRVGLAGQDVIVSQPPADDPSIIRRALACDPYVQLDPSGNGPAVSAECL